MKRVATRLRDDVHDAAERPADFRRVHARLDFHLGDGVDRRLHADCADGALVVVDAVDQVIVLIVHRAVDRHGGGLPAIVGPVAGRQRVRQPLERAGHELHQADDVASADRKILHGLLRNERAHRRRIGLQQRRFSRDEHALLHLSELQLRIEANAIARRQHDARRLARESLQLDVHGVRADRQQIEQVVAGFIGRRGAHVVRRQVFDRDGGAGQHGAATVGDASDDVGGRHLSGGRAGKREDDDEDAGTPAGIEHPLSSSR